MPGVKRLEPLKISSGEAWEERYDSSSNRRFYVNTTTKERQWAKPGKDALVFVRSSDWVIAKDRKSGKPYYVHSPTKKTQWEMPKEMVPQSSAEEERSATAQRKNVSDWVKKKDKK